MKPLILFFSFLFVFVVACSNVPLTSITKLNRIDPRTTDFERLRAVAKVPDAIDLSKVQLSYSLEISKVSSPGTTKSVRSKLQKIENDASAQALINREREEGYQMVVYKIPESDVTKIEALRDLGKQWKEEGAKVKGKAELKLSNFRYLPNHDHEGLKANVWVQTVETGDYVLILKNLDVSAPKI